MSAWARSTNSSTTAWIVGALSVSRRVLGPACSVELWLVTRGGLFAALELSVVCSGLWSAVGLNWPLGSKFLWQSSPASKAGQRRTSTMSFWGKENCRGFESLCGVFMMCPIREWRGFPHSLHHFGAAGFMTVTCGCPGHHTSVQNTYKASAPSWAWPL